MISNETFDNKNKTQYTSAQFSVNQDNLEWYFRNVNRCFLNPSFSGSVQF